MLPRGDQIALTIEKPAAGGRMLARLDGRVVLVAGAIPGERVRARVERTSKQVLFAEVVEVVEASPDRRGPGVDWACGGSLYAHIAYERQRSLKSELVADAFARIGKMRLDRPVPVAASPEDGYRMRARLHARGGRFGFFREGTHELCDPGPTRQLLPATLEALSRLEAALRGAGALRVASCELAENAPATERAMLVEIEPGGELPAAVGPVEGATGVLFADHTRSRVTVAHGSPYVADRLAVGGRTATLTHHVQSFFQGNRFLLETLAARVVSHIPDGEVVDLYAGVGLFAVALAARGCPRVVAVEGDRASARDLDGNAELYAGVIAVEHSPVEAYLTRPGTPRPDTLLLDPPRTGMSREALSAVIGLRPPRVVYVSCDLATLARDVKRLAEAGYTLDGLEAFDLFPNTAHVETLAVLSAPPIPRR